MTTRTRAAVPGDVEYAPRTQNRVVTLSRGGMLYLSAYYVEALGAPRYVSVGYSRGTRTLALRATAEWNAWNRRLTRPTAGNTGIISIKGALHYFSIPKARRLWREPAVIDGVLLLPLEDAETDS